MTPPSCSGKEKEKRREEKEKEKEKEKQTKTKMKRTEKKKKEKKDSFSIFGFIPTRKKMEETRYRSKVFLIVSSFTFNAKIVHFVLLNNLKKEVQKKSVSSVFLATKFFVFAKCFRFDRSPPTIGSLSFFVARSLQGGFFSNSFSISINQ